MDPVNNNFTEKFNSQLERLSKIRSDVDQLAVHMDFSESQFFHLLDDVSKKMITTYPGEHYRWLSAYVVFQKPVCIVELGTKNGLSLLSLVAAAHSLKESGYSPKIVSMDIFSVLTRRHFIPEEVINMENVSLVTGDATSGESYTNLGFPLSDCDFVFLDTQHTGEQEDRILRALRKAGLKDTAIILADDISLNDEMKNWWASIAMPKVSCNVHFSGSGLISFTPELLPSDQVQGNDNKEVPFVYDIAPRMLIPYIYKKLKIKLKKIFKFLVRTSKSFLLKS